MWHSSMHKEGGVCHGSDRDIYPQGRPGVARPSDTSAKNIGRKEC